MSAAHHPGPLWVEGSIYDGYAACVVGRVDVEGATVRETRTLAQFRHLPDAILYSAAPELLEALERLLVFAEDAETKALVGDEGCLWPCEEARAAIAKARGQW